MHLRAYESTDLAAVRALFRTTVERVAWRDYTPAQVSAWVGTDDDDVRADWQASLTAHHTLLAMVAETVVGFADMTPDGYLDRLYVDYAHQGQGIATALVRALEELVPTDDYTTFASLTARPFFERRGYQVLRENVVTRQGVALTNFEMRKDNA